MIDVDDESITRGDKHVCSSFTKEALWLIWLLDHNYYIALDFLYFHFFIFYFLGQAGSGRTEGTAGAGGRAGGPRF